MSKPGLVSKNRLIFIMIAFTFLILLLVSRVLWIQIVNGDKYKKAAYRQQSSDRILSPSRGIIFDRNGKELAISASVDTIFVNPKEIEGNDQTTGEIAEKLAQILSLKKKDVQNKLESKGTYQVIVRKIEKEIGDKVRKYVYENKLSGIYVDKDTKRFYPFKNLAAQVLGFTGVDNQGLAGIEFQMDQYLKGTPGRILGEVDVDGNELPSVNKNTIDPQDGTNVVLTLDETIQYFAESELQQAIRDYKVLNGGTAIVMDPRNGEILAMVSKPDFDLNAPFSVPQALWRNNAVDNTYEPGSTFKAIVAAAGLEEGVIKPETPVECIPVVVGGWKMSCWKDGGHGKETFEEAVYNSCNPVFVKLSEAMGAQTFFKYVRGFGFYDKTGITLPGETRSIMHTQPTVTDLATASYGQSFQVTPIQMISAYGAIANGGNLLKPQLIKELTDSNGNVIQKYEPEVIRNILSKKTSDKMKEILENVVAQGTGINAYVEGYKVAGKTATSQTFDQGVRSKDRFIASFCAFAPSDNPVICVLVILDYPSEYSHAGGVVAGPVAGKIVEESLNYLGVERKYSERDKILLTKEIYVPDVKKKKVGEVKKLLLQYGLDAKVIGGGDDDSEVIDQIPKEGMGVPYKSVVILNTSEIKDIPTVIMPDLTNKTISEATQTLNHLGLNLRVDGMGTAMIQEIPAGEEVPLGKIIKVKFRLQISEY